MDQRILQEEHGFTLVELLVTLSILAVLFGIVTLKLGGVGADAEDKTAIAECGVVQSAADIYLVGSTSASLTPRDPTDAAVISSGDTAEFKSYLRSLPTEFTYSWTAQGEVTCHDVTP